VDIYEKIKNKQIKRYLTTRERIVFPGAVYHITQRAPGRELVFIEKSDYLAFLSILKKTVKKFKLDLFCFSLLPNHLHLMLKINRANLSEAMQYLFQTYAFYYNGKYMRKGHVFCGRYRASLCNDDVYMLAVSVYIHLNPYKAGLTGEYRDYRWSSLLLYMQRDKETFVKYNEILLKLDEELKKARKKYTDILERSVGISGGSRIDLDSVTNFVEKATKAVRKFYKKDSELDELIEKFRKQKKVVKAEDKKARKYLIQQLKSNGYSVTEISKMLNLSRKTIYNIFK